MCKHERWAHIKKQWIKRKAEKVVKKQQQLKKWQTQSKNEIFLMQNRWSWRRKRLRTYVHFTTIVYTGNFRLDFRRINDFCCFVFFFLHFSVQCFCVESVIEHTILKNKEKKRNRKRKTVQRKKKLFLC